MRARAPDDDEEDDEEDAETRPEPLDAEDGIATAETVRLPMKSKARAASEDNPLQTNPTQPTPPALFEARRKERFWSYSLQALTLIAVAALVTAVVLMRQEPIQASGVKEILEAEAPGPSPTPLTGKSARALAEEASRLIEQRRYPEASAVLSRCLQLEPANSECRQLQQRASSSSR